MNAMDEVLRANIARIRVANGLRQADLAERMNGSAGWTASTVSWVENGRRQVSAVELVLLCQALGTCLDDILLGVTPSEPTEPARDVPAVRDDERKAASRLGLTREAFRHRVLATYGRTLDQERDRRIGDVAGMPPSTVQAKRGHATRAIVAELSVCSDVRGRA